MNLLLEIGCEEIPDWMLAGALEYLASALPVQAAIKTDATPRRLVLRADDVIEREPDKEERVWGPAKSAPQPAVEGFAKKQGVAVADLEVLSDGKAEKYSLIRKTAGRATKEILAEQLPGIILKTPFPKTMYWPGKGGPRFIRPIRWIVALLGDQVIPFEIAGVQSGNESRGHRKLSKGPFAVTYATYEQALRDNFVILSADERRSRIRAVKTKYRCDNDLLNVLVNLTEWPTPITGSFDEEFLSLPKEVLITVMKAHQKYFAVDRADGTLDNKFVAVTNTDGDPEGLIRHGNERVLKARFNDARFFWDADQKKKLADRVEDLKNVTFQAKLGSYFDKTNRVGGLVKEMNGGSDAERAAHLCKADLTTELVKEFTELQGEIGGLYAKHQGESEAVSKAIYDHYRPLSMEDRIPSTREGQILSIADKLDSLRGCFSVGLIPTGSKDPFALRRAAQGIIRILAEGSVGRSYQPSQESSAELREFFLDRVRYYFREVKGFAYDEVNAVLAAGWDDLKDAEARLEAIKQVRPTPNFEPVAAAFKRIRNILKQSGESQTGSLDPKRLEAGPESQLHAAVQQASSNFATLEYTGRLAAIANLRPAIDLFFDKVMVNAPDPAVRRNRLTLLQSMLSEFSTIADFSEIVTSTSASAQADESVVRDKKMETKQ